MSSNNLSDSEALDAIMRCFECSDSSSDSSDSEGDYEVFGCCPLCEKEIIEETDDYDDICYIDYDRDLWVCEGCYLSLDKCVICEDRGRIEDDGEDWVCEDCQYLLKRQYKKVFKELKMKVRHKVGYTVLMANKKCVPEEIVGEILSWL